MPPQSPRRRKGRRKTAKAKVSVPRQMCAHRNYHTSTKQAAIADLAVVAFYYLLRVGEYTHPRYVSRNGKAHRVTRTVQFAVQSVGFFKHSKLIPRTAPLSALLQADQATLKITNQKNGRMGQTIHHHANNQIDCPVHALARRVHHILSHHGTEEHLICDYCESGTWHSVTSTDIRQGIRTAVIELGLDKKGIDPDLVGVHSLRAGGAMAL